MQISADRVQEIVDAVLRDKLAGTPFDHAQIETERDFDGEPIIRVFVSFNADTSANAVLIDSASVIRDRLIEVGDDRYVYVSPRFPASDDADGDDAETSDRVDLP